MDPASRLDTEERYGSAGLGVERQCRARADAMSARSDVQSERANTGAIDAPGFAVELAAQARAGDDEAFDARTFHIRHDARARARCERPAGAIGGNVRVEMARLQLLGELVRV